MNLSVVVLPLSSRALRALGLSVFVGAACPVASASFGGGEIHVPKDFPTISEAIDDASDGTVIVVAAGTYNEAIQMWGDLTLISADGPEVTIIDATGLGMPTVDMWGTDSKARIEGFTIRGGSNLSGSLWGGGITAQFSEGTIANCIITENQAESGGGAAVWWSSDLTFEDCVFINNTANNAGFGAGGGAYVNDAIAVFINCTFENNQALSSGGALEINWQGNATLIDCTIINNSAEQGGGVSGSSIGAFTNCTLEGNTAGVGGGAFFFGNHNIAFTNSNFVSNTATFSGFSGGGGLHVEGGGSILLNGCTFTGNAAYAGAGAEFLFYNGTASIANCMFDSNIAVETGGGLSVWSGSGATVTGSTFTANEADRGAGAYVNSTAVTFDSCEFLSNTTTAHGNGGGINANANAVVNVLNSTFQGNAAPGFGFGGGIYIAPGATVTLFGSLVRENSTGNFGSPNGGGGAYVSTFDNPTFNVTASVFCQNTTGDIIGLWNNLGGNAMLASCADSPGNNGPENPTNVPSGGGSVWSTFYNATNSGSSSCDPDGVDVFFEYEVADGPITLALDTCGSEVDTAISVFDAKGQEIGCSADCDGDPCDGPPAACLVLEGLADGVYLIRVSQPTPLPLSGGGGAGAFVLNVAEIDGPTCAPSDLNCDGVVDVSDLLTLLGAWGPCPRSGDCPADINGDGVVDVSDLLLLLANWG